MDQRGFFPDGEKASQRPVRRRSLSRSQGKAKGVKPSPGAASKPDKLVLALLANERLERMVVELRELIDSHEESALGALFEEVINRGYGKACKIIGGEVDG